MQPRKLLHFVVHVGLSAAACAVVLGVAALIEGYLHYLESRGAGKHILVAGTLMEWGLLAADVWIFCRIVYREFTVMWRES